jgi:trehalose/maltose hydrolase-like predicted phosphorylase
MTEHDTITEDTWTLTYDAWHAERQPLREAICTLGNGYFATRGAAEETAAGGSHYPGTYLAGGYNRLESEISGRVLENEDLVNWPNWLCLSVRAEGEDWFHIDSADLLDFRQDLKFREGILERRIRFRHAGDRETTLVSRRLVHMAHPHLAAIEWLVTPENWSGQLEIRSALDGNVCNQGVARYRDLNSRHLEVVEMGRTGEDGVYLAVQTNQSRIRMVQAARTQVFADDEPAVLDRETIQMGGVVEQRLVVECQREKPLRIEKIVALYTSRDFAISEPTGAACQAVRRAGTFRELRASHRLAWERLWNRADIELGGGDAWSQRVLRLHLFHLLQTTSFNSTELDVGVPSRGLHGEAYRGHIFWDELFIFPLLNLRIPEITRALLMYRYRRLEEARHLAREAGYQGAMYPWQSGSSGREESQVLHLNPQSGQWMPDDTHRQRHINAAIAYNVWHYFQATGDIEFLSFYGAEMLLEIARFWASIATYNADRDRYEIHTLWDPMSFTRTIRTRISPDSITTLTPMSWLPGRYAVLAGYCNFCRENASPN